MDNLGDLHEKNGGVALMMMLTPFHRCVEETKLLQRLAEQKKTKNEGSGEGRLGHARAGLWFVSYTNPIVCGTRVSAVACTTERGRRRKRRRRGKFFCAVEHGAVQKEGEGSPGVDKTVGLYRFTCRRARARCPCSCFVLVLSPPRRCPPATADAAPMASPRQTELYWKCPWSISTRDGCNKTMTKVPVAAASHRLRGSATVAREAVDILGTGNSRS